MKPIKSQRLVLTLNSHSLSAFQSCARKYYLGSAENLVQVGHYAPFDTGTEIHRAIFRMNRGKIRRPNLTPAQNLNLGIRAMVRSKWWQGLDAEKRMFHQTKLMQYAAWRSTKSWLTPHGAEVGFSKIIYEDKNVVFIYEGRIDDISEFNPEGTPICCWVDYKTEGRETHHYHNRNQFLGYSWALGTNYGFIVHYGLQKEKEDAFRYASIYHQKELINQWREDTVRTFREIINKIPFGANEFRRNRSACDAGNYGLCSYVRLCDNNWAAEEIQKGMLKIHYEVKEWRSW